MSLVLYFSDLGKSKVSNCGLPRNISWLPSEAINCANKCLVPEGNGYEVILTEAPRSDHPLTPRLLNNWEIE